MYEREKRAALKARRKLAFWPPPEFAREHLTAGHAVAFKNTPFCRAFSSGR
jgi:hypothetical protein